jgi:hypothetical protein
MEESGTSAGWHETKSVRFTVNGKTHHFDIGTGPRRIAPSHTLHTLRETLALTGTKTGYDQTTAKKTLTPSPEGSPITTTGRRYDDQCLHELE